jgi:hypothetical protein
MRDAAVKTNNFRNDRGVVACSHRDAVANRQVVGQTPDLNAGSGYRDDLAFQARDAQCFEGGCRDGAPSGYGSVSVHGLKLSILDTDRILILNKMPQKDEKTMDPGRVGW